MNSFTLAFKVVMPLFLMMSLGYFLKLIGVLTETFLHNLNSLCFKVFLPMLLFINIYESDFSQSFQPKLLLYAVCSIVLMFVVLMLLIPKIIKSNPRRGAMVQGMFRSNFILFGMPLTISLFGQSQLGTVSILIAFIVPILNLLSVIVLEVFRDGKTSYKRIIMGIIKNPLILAALLAFVFVLTGLKLPSVFESTINDISKIATPLALIVLGGSFEFSHLRPNWKCLTFAVIGKLVAMPFCFISLAIILGFRGVELGALFTMFASPTAVSSFSMAQQMDADDKLAGQIVVVSSIFSVISIFIWITALTQMGVML